MRIHPSFLVVLATTLLLTPGPGHAQELFVTTTTFEVEGSCSVMDMEPPFATTLDLYVLGNDAVARKFDRYVFVVNRAPLDNILVLDAANAFAAVNQYNIGDGDGSNLQDFLWVGPDKAYVTRYEKTEVWIVDPLTGNKRGEIDLAPYADADGIPEMSQMAKVGERVFVALQRLNRDAGFSVTGTSQLVVIDSATDTVLDIDPETPAIDTILLQHQNPFWRIWFEPLLSRLVVVCPGTWFTLDGGAEIVNPFLMRSEGTLVDEAELGGDLLDVAVFSPQLGYALVGEFDFDTCVVSFDPTTGSVLSTVRCSAGFNLTDLEISDAGRLYVGDRTGNDPGVRVFEASTGAAISGSPVDVGLPPFDLALVETSTTSAEPPPPMSRRAELSARPNPFNPRTTVELRYAGNRPAEAPLVRVLDARGRRVAELHAVTAGAQSFGYTWDGTARDGHEVSSGVYTAAPSDASAPAVRLVLVR